MLNFPATFSEKMSKNYDNWERLVTAVLRREWDKQIALSHSRDPSSDSSTLSSSDLSFTSTSQFNHHDDQSLVLRERSQLPMDYSDLTLDHCQWKTMLPPGKREVAWRSASLSFSLDGRTEKNCFLLGATNLIMSSGEGFESVWERKSHPKSRFSEVAELVAPSFYVSGSIRTQMLSPETLYAAYFVFGFTDKYEEKSTINSFINISYGESDYDYSEMQSRIVNFQAGKGRADGWMEIQLGDFYNGVGGNGKVVIVELEDTSGFRKGGIIMEGIEFRPLKGKKNRRGKGTFPKLKIS